MDYDLLVIGEDRGGIERAIAAAQQGDRVAIVGTGQSAPSLDSMRLAIINLAEQREVTMAAWRAEVSRLNRCQLQSDNAELDCFGVERITGQAKFVSPRTVTISHSHEQRIVSSTEIVLACGSRSQRPPYLRCDDHFVLTIESLLGLVDVPRSTIIVGAGETGLSAAIMLADLGVDVTVVDEHVTLLELCGMFDPTFDAIQSLDIAFRLDDAVIGTELRPDLQAGVRLASGRVIVADSVLICVAQEGRTDGLNLETAGVGVDERGRVWCDDSGRTWAPTIAAVGRVAGLSRTERHSRSDIELSAIAFDYPVATNVRGEPGVHHFPSVRPLISAGAAIR